MRGEGWGGVRGEGVRVHCVSPLYSLHLANHCGHPNHMIIRSRSVVN